MHFHGDAAVGARVGKPDFIADLFCDVVAVLARAGSDPSLDPSRSSDLEDLRLAAVTCASEVLRLVRPDTEHAVALTADRNLPGSRIRGVAPRADGAPRGSSRR